mmetsp:Transcript_11352/g.23701  ORF Transcript_11352/g.23701 Transcript_11352/m.23701 type:complete len:537 (-) Transcript_11352:1380-2990(-)
MSGLTRELIVLVLQFLDEEGMLTTLHALEAESGLFFNQRYFERLILHGKWDELEKYLVGFTHLEDNRYSQKAFFDIRKHKFLEALDKKDRHLAADILLKDLRVFKQSNEQLYQEMASLITLDDFRENEHLANYGHTEAARERIRLELLELVEGNPKLQYKLQFPAIRESTLKTLVGQSLGRPSPPTVPHREYPVQRDPQATAMHGTQNPNLKTLLPGRPRPAPHGCALAHTYPAGLAVGGGASPVPVLQPGMDNWNSAGAPPAAAAHAALATAAGSAAEAAAGVPPGHLKRGRPPSELAPAPPNPEAAAAAAKRNRLAASNGAHAPRLTSTEEGPPQPTLRKVLSAPTAGGTQDVGDTLPQLVVRTMPLKAKPTAINFHPSSPSLLLVGLADGSFTCIDVVNKVIRFDRASAVYHASTAVFDPAAGLQGVAIPAPVSRIQWGPNGSFFGVAYTNCVVQVYIINSQVETTEGTATVAPILHLELFAHEGIVHDLAFLSMSQGMCLVTCGEDSKVKVRRLTPPLARRVSATAAQRNRK